MSAKFDRTNRQVVAALFPDRYTAERAINDLKDAGFRGDQIGVAMRNEEGQREVTQTTGTNVAKGATSGAVGGGVLGGLAGFLAGVGALAIPGVGPVIAGGVLASTLAGAGIGAAGGGILGALVGLGIPEEHAKYYESGFRSGKVLVTVSGNRLDEAYNILQRAGADFAPGYMH